MSACVVTMAKEEDRDQEKKWTCSACGLTNLSSKCAKPGCSGVREYERGRPGRSRSHERKMKEREEREGREREKIRKQRADLLERQSRKLEAFEKVQIPPPSKK